MERADFLNAGIEDKLLMLFDEIQSLKRMVKPNRGIVVEKDTFKISEAAKMLHRSYSTIDKYCADLGINYGIENGLKILTMQDMEKLALHCGRADMIS